MKSIKISRDPGGLTFITSEAPHMSSVSLGIWIGVGGRYEPARLNGVAHFIEHMLFKGTAKRSAAQISEAVEGVGGYLNAFTSEEHTCYFSKAPAEHLNILLEVLADMLLRSKFAPAEIRTERDVIKEEVAMCHDDPHQLVQELINQTLWPDDPLGRPLTGTNESLDGLHRRHLIDFHRRHYVTGNIVIAAAGHVRHEEMLAQAARHVRLVPAGRRSAPPVLSCRQDKPRVRLHSKDTAQAQLALGIRTCPRHDERRYALRLLNAILGENMSSRLFQELREERGLAYHVQSSTSFFDDAGTLDIGVGLDTENVPTALRLILRELRRLGSRPVSGGELRRGKDYLLGQMALSLENTENQMNWLGEQWLGFGKIVPPSEVSRCLWGVTARQVQAVAASFFRPERLNLALVSPLKSGRRLERLMATECRAPASP